MAERHIPYYSLKKLFSFFNGVTVCFLVMVIILIVQITAATVVLAFFPVVQEVALEHNFMTLRKNYRGYKEPDDYSMQWNLVMEKVYVQKWNCRII